MQLLYTLHGIFCLLVYCFFQTRVWKFPVARATKYLWLATNILQVCLVLICLRHFFLVPKSFSLAINVLRDFSNPDINYTIVYYIWSRRGALNFSATPLCVHDYISIHDLILGIECFCNLEQKQRYTTGITNRESKNHSKYLKNEFKEFKFATLIT